jgi:sn-glycerol 3-phosphate transport system ATP-binding protein
MSFLSVEQLSKHWDNTHAVQDINFEIRQGEFVAFLGPSGCGKSTTLKMIAGLETPSSGRIILNGEDIALLPPGKRGLSMVFQSYALFPHLSVKENILFGLKARKVSTAEQNKRLKEAVELVNLGEQINKKPSQLSGGQCQRVALARAIVSQAPLCLMDEPLSNLDAKLRNEMRFEIRSLQKKLGLTVIYVTHDQIEAMSMADRIILLNNGKIEQIGSPAQMYNYPKSCFVASFIGHPPMNLIQTSDQIIGIRPEHIKWRKGEDVKPNSKVLICDYQGADTLITLDYQGSTLILSHPGQTRLNKEDPIEVYWDTTQEQHFSLTTRQSLTQSCETQTHL